MALIKRISSATLFPNGMLAVFDTNGKRVGELQGAYSIEKHRDIYIEAADHCEFKGFHILPEGFFPAEQIRLCCTDNLTWAEFINQ